MLLTNITNYLNQLLAEKKDNLALFQEEKAYIEKRGLLKDANNSLVVSERDPLTRFQNAYIERCVKETDELIAEEASKFLEKPIQYFKNHIEEYIYVESEWFALIGVDAVSFEADSVFGTYDVMLGLRLPKKVEKVIKEHITNQLNQSAGSYALLFNANEGLWDFNFSLNSLPEYREDWTINEAYCAIYRFLFQLMETVEAASS